MNSPDIRVVVRVLVMAIDAPSILFVRLPGETGPVLPGGSVPRRTPVRECAADYLLAQTNLPIPVGRLLVFDQTFGDGPAEQPETHTLVMAAAWVDRAKIPVTLPAATEWLSVESQATSSGIVKYAVYAAGARVPFSAVLLNGEGTDEERRQAQGPFAPA